MHWRVYFEKVASIFYFIQNISSSLIFRATSYDKRIWNDFTLQKTWYGFNFFTFVLVYLLTKFYIHEITDYALRVSVWFSPLIHLNFSVSSYFHCAYMRYNHVLIFVMQCLLISLLNVFKLLGWLQKDVQMVISIEMLHTSLGTQLLNWVFSHRISIQLFRFQKCSSWEESCVLKCGVVN